MIARSIGDLLESARNSRIPANLASGAQLVARLDADSAEVFARHMHGEGVTDPMVLMERFNQRLQLMFSPDSPHVSYYKRKTFLGEVDEPIFDQTACSFEWELAHLLVGAAKSCQPLGSLVLSTENDTNVGLPIWVVPGYCPIGFLRVLHVIALKVASRAPGSITLKDLLSRMVTPLNG